MLGAHAQRAWLSQSAHALEGLWHLTHDGGDVFVGRGLVVGGGSSEWWVLLALGEACLEFLYDGAGDSDWGLRLEEVESSADFLGGGEGGDACCKALLVGGGVACGSGDQGGWWAWRRPALRRRGPRRAPIPIGGCGAPVARRCCRCAWYPLRGITTRRAGMPSSRACWLGWRCRGR